ncbi:hypothetical protein FGE12_26575 [Aggregicoccus sp. 17bor-14]|uniref:hypothetical protein n=1 Tax=Myxococcaceae TaxID=31 RepID=UPI00129C23C8|nr:MULTISPECIES: hypothetical protein [Myxococcaceae]MBF5046006.1 hypothetical protein [Simulacricoccus sp. 17bor-14]MRI91737.1 hypothetical protein [Aggregicoccus sp. 17bor-14]
MLPLQLALTPAVPAVLLGGIWLGVRLVRWAKQRPADAASALLTLYTSAAMHDPEGPHDGPEAH